MNESRYSKQSDDSRPEYFPCYANSESEGSSHEQLPRPLSTSTISTHYEPVRANWQSQYNGEYGTIDREAENRISAFSHVQPSCKAPYPVLPTVTPNFYSIYQPQLALAEVGFNNWRSKFYSIRSRASRWWNNRTVKY